MSHEAARPKLSGNGMLSPDNCGLTLIDPQPQILCDVSNFDRRPIINNNAAVVARPDWVVMPVLCGLARGWTNSYPVPLIERTK